MAPGHSTYDNWYFYAGRTIYNFGQTTTGTVLLGNYESTPTGISRDMRLVSSNLGVGTVSPVHKLDVADTTTGMVTHALFGAGKAEGQCQICVGTSSNAGGSVVLGYDVANNYASLHISGNTFGSQLVVTSKDYVGIGKTNPGSKLAVTGLPMYANNTAALAGGLTAGDFYMTSTGTVMVTY